MKTGGGGASSMLSFARRMPFGMASRRRRIPGGEGKGAKEGKPADTGDHAKEQQRNPAEQALLEEVHDVARGDVKTNNAIRAPARMRSSIGASPELAPRTINGSLPYQAVRTRCGLVPHSASFG